MSKKALKTALLYKQTGHYTNDDLDAIVDAFIALAEQPAQQEPCCWQFFQDGKWHNGMETNNHRANTEAAGVPVRDVYPSPQPPAQQGPVAWMDGPHLVMRSDWRDRANYKGPWVDFGRAIPDSWVPVLYTTPQLAQP